MPSAILESIIGTLKESFDQISAKRKGELDMVTSYIQAKQQREANAKITVICTHNSRRSHIAQVWLAVAAKHYGVAPFNSYSGGTEGTAFNYRSVAALKRAGFDLEMFGDGDNPLYRFVNEETVEYLFSKVYHHPSNPAQDFAALIVCDSADKGCPIVQGAEQRFFIGYIDPKVSDDTEEESTVYYNKVLEIGREMLYLMSRV